MTRKLVDVIDTAINILGVNIGKARINHKMVGVFITFFTILETAGNVTVVALIDSS
jgi:hypothetical protein